MIKLYKGDYRNKELIHEFNNKEEFDKFAELFAEEMSSEWIDKEKILWDIYINDSVYIPDNDYWYLVTDTTGEWFREEGWFDEFSD